MTTSPSKEATPVETSATENAMAAFTEKEQNLIIVAFSCLKSGAPQIDFDKFMKAGEFNTMKTAQNTWGKIKNKLPKVEVAEGEEGEVATPKTPKAKATPKKRAPKKEVADDNEDDEEDGGSPKKKARKSPAKRGKKEVVAAADDVKEEVVEDAE